MTIVRAVTEKVGRHLKVAEMISPLVVSAEGAVENNKWSLLNRVTSAVVQV